MQFLYYNGGFEHLQEFAQLAAKPLFNSEKPVDAVIFHDLRKGSCIETVRHKPSNINARTSEFRYRSALDLLQDKQECEEFFTLEDKLRNDKSAPDLNRYQELLEKQQEAARKQYSDWYGIVKGNLPSNVPALIIPGWNDTVQINYASKGAVKSLNIGSIDIAGKKIAGIGALDASSQRVPYDLAPKVSEFDSKDQPEEKFIASSADADLLVVSDPIAGYCDKKLPDSRVSRANRLANFVRESVTADWSLDGIAKQKRKIVITPAASSEPKLAWTMVNDSIVLNAGPSSSVRKPLAYLITYGDHGVEAPIIALEPDGRHHPVLTEENIKHPPASRYGTRITRAVRPITPIATPVVVLPRTTRKSTAKKAPAGMSPLEMTIAQVWKSIEPHIKNLGEAKKDAVYAIKDALMDTELHNHVERIEALESTIELAAYDLTGAAHKYSRDLITAYVGYLGKTSFVSRKPDLFKSVEQLSKSLPRRHLKAVKDKLKEYQKECRELHKQLNNVYQSYGMAYRFAKRAGKAMEECDFDKSRELYEHAHMVAPFEHMKETLAFNVGFAFYQQAETSDAPDAKLYEKAIEWFKSGPRDAETREFIKYCRFKINENAA